MINTIPFELRKLGLKEKEVEVYLAGLSLGPCSIQDIAQNTGIARPTAHEIVKSLRQRGLFTEILEEKKRHVVAQSPEHILSLLRIQKREIEEREREFTRIMASLEAEYGGKEHGLEIYHGKEAIDVVKEKLLLTSSGNMRVITDGKQKYTELYAEVFERTRNLRVQELCTAKKPDHSPASYIEQKSCSISMPGSLIIGDNVTYFPSENEAYCIENQVLLKLFESLFESMWKMNT